MDNPTPPPDVDSLNSNLEHSTSPPAEADTDGSTVFVEHAPLLPSSSTRRNTSTSHRRRTLQRDTDDDADLREAISFFREASKTKEGPHQGFLSSVGEMLFGVPDSRLSLVKIDIMQVINAYQLGCPRPYQPDYTIPTPHQAGTFHVSPHY